MKLSENKKFIVVRILRTRSGKIFGNKYTSAILFCNTDLKIKILDSLKFMFVEIRDGKRKIAMLVTSTFGNRSVLS